MAAIEVKEAVDKGVEAQVGTVDKTVTNGAQPLTFGGKTYDSVDDLGKAYEALQTDHGKWTQQYGDLDKKHKELSEYAQKWSQWWEGIKPLWGKDVEEFLQQKQNGGSRAAPARPQSQDVSQTQDVFEGWDLLRPQEQYSKFRQMMVDELGAGFREQLAQLAKAVNETLVQKENWYQTYLNNHLGLLRRALEQKFKDPNFEIDKVMEMAAQAIGGQIDPIQLGQQLISASSFPTQLESVRKQAYEQGKKDLEQEMANKKQETVPPVSTSVPRFTMKLTPGASKQGLSGLRQSAAERILKEFGPQWFTG